MNNANLSQLQPIAFGARMKMINPPPPPTNAELEIKPLKLMTLVVSVLMVASGIFVKATYGSGLWDPAISKVTTLGVSLFLIIAGMVVFLATIFGRLFRDGISFINFVALMSGSAWQFKQNNAELIRRLITESDAFDAELLRLTSAEVVDEDSVARLVVKRRALVSEIDPLLGELLIAFFDDQKRECFLAGMANGQPHSKEVVLIVKELAKKARGEILAAGAKLGLKPGLLAKHISYLA